MIQLISLMTQNKNVNKNQLIIELLKVKDKILNI